MALPVYAWPPVGAVGAEWDYVAPISESFSALTGKRYVSAARPARRVATVEVSAQSSNRTGAGYVVMLKRLLDGGVNLVRLTSYPLARFLDTADQNALRQSVHLDWTSGGIDLGWTTPPTELLWYDGTILTGVIGTSGIYDIVTVSGLPPRTLVARPGEYLTAFADEDDVIGSTVQVLAPAWSYNDGTAVIRLFSPLAYGGRINIGVKDTAVFRVVGALPRAVQPVRGDWSYTWQFEEVFSDEVGGFTERTGWWKQTGPAA